MRFSFGTVATTLSLCGHLCACGGSAKVVAPAAVVIANEAPESAPVAADDSLTSNFRAASAWADGIGVGVLQVLDGEEPPADWPILERGGSGPWFAAEGTAPAALSVAMLYAEGRVLLSDRSESRVTVTFTDHGPRLAAIRPEGTTHREWSDQVSGFFQPIRDLGTGFCDAFREGQGGAYVLSMDELGQAIPDSAVLVRASDHLPSDRLIAETTELLRTETLTHLNVHKVGVMLRDGAGGYHVAEMRVSLQERGSFIARPLFALTAMPSP